MDYIEVAEAIDRPGLRMVLGRGMPGPWGVAALAMMEMKGIAFIPVVHRTGEPNEALQAWTGQNSAPCAVLDNERPRSHWSEILLLAERLAPEPRLIPTEAAERALMFGIAHEICGEDGLGWNARLLLFDAQAKAGGVLFPTLMRKYTAGLSMGHARARMNAVIEMLAARLGGGARFLLGDRLTAIDIYWAAFSNLFSPMVPELCEMPDLYRQLGALMETYLDNPLPPALIAHRDRIVRDHFATVPISI